MSATRIHSQPKSWLWGTLTSIRLTVFLLLILAAVAVIGTVVPQNQPPSHYVSRFGEVWGQLLWLGGFTQVYFSPWFLGPISLLAANILACVVHGLPRAVKRAWQPLNVETALTLPERGQITWPAGVDPQPHIAATLSRELGRCRQETFPDQKVYLLERGRFRPVGPYLIHIALLMILAGGLIGKFWGVDGQLAIDQGEVAGAFQVGHRVEKPLNFQVRLDQFQVSYYEPGGSPKEFRSDLTFMQDGREVSRATCRVNEPVTFGGLTFYQSSYGTQATGPIGLKVQLGDLSESIEAPLRRAADLPGGRGKIIPMKVDGNFQGYGPAVLLAFSPGSGHPQVFWILKDQPGLGQQPGPYRFTVESIPFGYYSVFQVKHDPGVAWVYAGFLLFLPGLYLAFFRPVERWALVVAKTSEGRWQGRLLGACPRHREEFAARQERLLMELKRGIPS
ncbi:MAG: cytochrome c biogenesis protein ResB [Proteobacteria bacterium]|nr:cytochrome c biogenesis protein ResB [Pseudomonadota bacterium]MBU4356664.1 cytochrome c biogenesis protein ResB [Pseudomonadota bacterium]